jgi:hypothetical protein
MAVKQDKTTLAAAKARKQRIIVIVGGVILLGLAAIQGPKLWKQLNPPAPGAKSAAAAPATTTATGSVVDTAAPAAVASSSVTVAVVAGVPISAGGAKPSARDGKLVAFTLFKAKDPFVQQVSDGSTAPDSSTTSTQTSSSGSSTTAPSSGQTASGAPSDTAAATGGTQTAPPAKPAFATIEVNDKAQQLALKDTFPKSNPTFVLVAVTRSSARIGVAGGTFDDGKTLTLKMKKRVILADTATGVRYALKLVYTGATAEKVEGFTTASPDTTTASKP